MKRQIVREAIDFVCEQEALSAEQRRALEAVPIRWRRRRGASRFYLRAVHGFAGPHILISVGRGSVVRWHTYRRVRAGLVTPPEGVPVAAALHARIALVHELTHAVQHGMCGTPRRRYSEVETTANEIEFVRRVAPEVHVRLVPIEKRRAKPREGTRESRPVSRWAGLSVWLRALLRA
ncbi:MAG: hypothetical protein FJ292_00255 [Planctomycetes bacterium]|nr:hypothetical protein [Planctomycetota bacterium]